MFRRKRTIDYDEINAQFERALVDVPEEMRNHMRILHRIGTCQMTVEQAKALHGGSEERVEG